MTTPEQQGRRNRTKGRQFQSATRDHLRTHGLRVIEEGGAGLAGGDLFVSSPKLGLLALECKSGRTQLGTDWRQALEQTQGTRDLPVLIHKRHGVADPGEQWVTMTLDVLAELVRRADGGDQ